MKITFPTDDRKTIAKRTGRCKEFSVYSIDGSTVTGVEYIKNTHSHHDHEHGYGQGHGHHDHKKGEGEHNHEEIGTILKDTDVLIVGRLGKFMKKALENFNIRYNLTKKILIEEALTEYLESKI